MNTCSPSGVTPNPLPVGVKYSTIICCRRVLSTSKTWFMCFSIFMLPFIIVKLLYEVLDPWISVVLPLDIIYCLLQIFDDVTYQF